jgi:hypothetical protein
MGEDTTPWSEKYRPSSMDQLVGNTEAMRELHIAALVDDAKWEEAVLA